MAVSLSVIAAKDSAGTAIAGGLQAQDKSGAGSGPFTLGQILIDGVAGTNMAQVTATNAVKVDGSAAIALNTGVRSATTQRVTIATDDVVPASQSGTWTVQPGNTANTTPWLAKVSDGTNAAAIKAASTAPTGSDTALVVSISPNSVNANQSDGSLQTSVTHVGAPTINYDAYSQYETVAASATDQVMGATGAQYDYLAGVLIIPGTAAAGAVSIKDGNGSAISVFAGGGTTALPSLAPILVPLGLHCLAGTTPGWKITTGTNVTAIGIGKFT